VQKKSTPYFREKASNPVRKGNHTGSMRAPIPNATKGERKGSIQKEKGIYHLREGKGRKRKGNVQRLKILLGV